MIVSFSFGHRLPHLGKMILSQGDISDIHDWPRLRTLGEVRLNFVILYP